MSGRILAFGDIHGCGTAFNTLLEHLVVQHEDTLVILGDVVDRGPETPEVISRLIQLKRQCQLKFILGNHEEMMLTAIDHDDGMAGWLKYGGQDVVASYGGIDRIPNEHLDFLRGGLDYYETPTDIFVHASLEPGVPLVEQTSKWLRWTRFTGWETPLPTGQRVVCGHTPQSEGLPRRSRGWACIDTCAVTGGWLTCLDVLTDEIFQSNQNGKIRTGIL